MTLGEVLLYISDLGTPVAGATPNQVDDAVVALIRIAQRVNARHQELAGTPIDLTTLREYPE